MAQNFLQPSSDHFDFDQSLLAFDSKKIAIIFFSNIRKSCLTYLRLLKPLHIVSLYTYFLVFHIMVIYLGINLRPCDMRKIILNY